MKRKNISLLKLRKNKISNLNQIFNKFGGNNTESDTATITECGTQANPNLTIHTCYCGDTETCETECGDCNTNDTTRGQQSPSLQVACNALGSIIGC